MYTLCGLGTRRCRGPSRVSRAKGAGFGSRGTVGASVGSAFRVFVQARKMAVASVSQYEFSEAAELQSDVQQLYRAFILKERLKSQWSVRVYAFGFRG